VWPCYFSLLYLDFDSCDLGLASDDDGKVILARELRQPGFAGDRTRHRRGTWSAVVRDPTRIKPQQVRIRSNVTLLVIQQKSCCCFVSLISRLRRQVCRCLTPYFFQRVVEETFSVGHDVTTLLLLPFVFLSQLKVFLTW